MKVHENIVKFKNKPQDLKAIVLHRIKSQKSNLKSFIDIRSVMMDIGNIQSAM